MHVESSRFIDLQCSLLLCCQSYIAKYDAISLCYSELGSNYPTHCKYYTNECDSQVVSVNRLVSAIADISCMAAT